MPKKETENTLFNSRDLEHNNWPKHGTNPQEIHNNNAQTPYPDNSWIDQPQGHWHPSMQHVNYDQDPSAMTYNQPHDHQTVHPAHSQHPPIAHHQSYDHQINHPTHPQHPSMAYNQPYDYQITHPAQPQYPPDSVMQPDQSSKIYHLHNLRSLPRAPLGRTSEPVALPSGSDVFNHSSVPIPLGPTQHNFPPAMSPQYVQPPLPLPRHHSRHHSCHHPRQPPPPYYDDGFRLPRIRRKPRPREYDDDYRYRNSDPFLMSYFPRRSNDHRHQNRNRWYA
ncbi:unnamed protein product [Rotaria sp. Silwood1]|nr:unnamed protein product [Rotaria sp. Silwood1]